MTTTPEKADIVDRLNNIRSDDDHKRGCQGRTYSCSCGLDDRTRGTAIDAATEIASLRRELEEAREALEPFAEAAHSYDPDEGDGDDIAWSHDFTIGSLRRARAAIRNLVGEKA